jgi:hypothetical protein
MATSSSKPASTAARGAARSGIQTAEQMDSRRSVRPFGRTACWRRPVGRDAAGKAACRSRRACSHPFGGGVAHELGLFCARLILSGFGWPVARSARHQVSTMADRSRENSPSSYDQSHPRLSRSCSVDQRPVRAGLCLPSYSSPKRAHFFAFGIICTGIWLSF